VPKGSAADRTNVERALLQEEFMEASRRKLAADEKVGVAEWVAKLRSWDLFVTLTYDQRRLEYTPSFPSAQRHVVGWLADVQGALGRPVCAVFGLESQKNGWPHAHGLLEVGGLGEGDIARAGRLWFEAWGFNRLEAPRSRGDVAGYCAKYVVKEDRSGLVFFGPLEQLRWALS